MKSIMMMRMIIAMIIMVVIIDLTKPINTDPDWQNCVKFNLVRLVVVKTVRRNFSAPSLASGPLKGG